MNLAEIESEIMKFSHLLDESLAYARKKVHEHAKADVAYKGKYAEAFLRVEGAGVLREQLALTPEVLQAREEAQLASDMVKVALSAIQARRTQISALMTLLSAHRAEAEFARTGPR